MTYKNQQQYDTAKTKTIKGIETANQRALKAIAVLIGKEVPENINFLDEVIEVLEQSQWVGLPQQSEKIELLKARIITDRNAILLAVNECKEAINEADKSVSDGIAFDELKSRITKHLEYIKETVNKE